MTRLDGMLSRREYLRLAAAGALGVAASGWLPRLAADAASHPERKRACILLWMGGGPSQIDTFDPKPGEPTGGSFKAIDTAVAGIRVCEHLPKVAARMKDLAIVRSMSTKEGDHGRATYHLRTGYVQQEPIQYPTFGSLVAKELGQRDAELPAFVSIASRRGLSDAGFSAGFLGAGYAPLLVGNSDAVPYQGRSRGAQELAVPDVQPPRAVADRVDDRLEMIEALNRDFTPGRDGVAADSVKAAYERALRLMRGKARTAFDLDEEKAELREAYGQNLFGQGCLLARRLVERGVPFVEVYLNRAPTAMGGWDTHFRNFDTVAGLCGVLDPGWATLLGDLQDRGLLATTTVVWMGEFGRTPRINPNGGRDHYPNAWSVVLGGGGIKGGQVYGRTSKDGATVEDKSVGVPDLLATICRAIGIDPMKQNISNIARPIRIVDKAAKPLTEVLA
jgi:hypothetical protein